MQTNTTLTSFSENLRGFLSNTYDFVFIKDQQSIFVSASLGLCRLVKMDEKNNETGTGTVLKAIEARYFNTTVQALNTQARCRAQALITEIFLKTYKDLQ